MSRVSSSLITRGRTARGEACVFKRLRPEDSHREDLALRLRNEQQVLTVLAGTTGVIRLLEVHQHPLSLALEFADGGSLDQRLADRSLPEDERLNIARALLAAVAACHARGVIHRDIKPSNLLFVHGSVVLADFGVAAWGDPPRAVPQGWEEDEIGTPPWSAPELRHNATNRVDPSVDVYGAAAVIQALLTSARGDPPITAGAAAAPSGTKLGPRPNLSECLAAALSSDPRQRPTLDELVRCFT